MKKAKIIMGCTLVLICLMTFSWSVKNEVDQETIASLVIQTEEINQARGTVEYTMLIEWHKNVSETRKKEVREYYKERKTLRYYYLCEFPEFETWVINRNSDTPVEPDDDVQKRTLNLTCEDI